MRNNWREIIVEIMAFVWLLMPFIGILTILIAAIYFICKTL